jgi:hypothetical protein
MRASVLRIDDAWDSQHWHLCTQSRLHFISLQSLVDALADVSLSSASHVLTSYVISMGTV